MYPLHEAYGFEPIRNNNTVPLCGAADTLRGGAGLDTYAFASGDGWDWIEDADGLGNIRYDGIALAGGVHVATGFWQQKDAASGKTFTYSLDERSENGETFRVLTIQAPDAGGGIRIKGWQPGQLGIVLGEAAPPLVLPRGASRRRRGRPPGTARTTPSSKTRTASC